MFSLENNYTVVELNQILDVATSTKWFINDKTQFYCVLIQDLNFCVLICQTSIKMYINRAETTHCPNIYSNCLTILFLLSFRYVRFCYEKPHMAFFWKHCFVSSYNVMIAPKNKDHSSVFRAHTECRWLSSIVQVVKSYESMNSLLLFWTNVFWSLNRQGYSRFCCLEVEGNEPPDPGALC